MKNARTHISQEQHHTMNDNMNERSSLISTVIDNNESVTDDMQFDDQRVRFIVAYVNLVFGVTSKTGACRSMSSYVNLT
jgi:hypothetical protein